MAKILNFPNKEDEGPYLQGPCICLNCKHTWQGVMPAGVWEGLECSECGLSKGVLNGTPYPDDVWECKCGCMHMFISSEKTICCNCGLTQIFPW